MRDDRLVTTEAPAQHHARGSLFTYAVATSPVSVRDRPSDPSRFAFARSNAVHAVLLGQLRDGVLTGAVFRH